MVLNQAQRSDNNEISEEEFEELLDQIHGKGKFDPVAVASNDSVNKHESENYSTRTLHKRPVEVKASNTAHTNDILTPQNDSNTVFANKVKPSAETTVRVDTQRLDDIMLKLFKS